MAFARIMEDTSISRSHRYTMEDSEISISVVMETFNGEPSMYLLVSYPMDCFLKVEDLLFHASLCLDTEANIEGHSILVTLGFTDPLLASNTDESVFCHTLSFAVNEIHRLAELNDMRKTTNRPI